MLNNTMKKRNIYDGIEYKDLECNEATSCQSWVRGYTFWCQIYNYVQVTSLCG